MCLAKDIKLPSITELANISNSISSSSCVEENTSRSFYKLHLMQNWIEKKKAILQSRKMNHQVKLGDKSYKFYKNDSFILDFLGVMVEKYQFFCSLENLEYKF